MKIGVLSDTHGHLASAKLAINQMHDVDILVHLGDYCNDARVLSIELQREIICVKGNCDFSTSIPLERMLEINGSKIYIVHGHVYGVKWGYDDIIARGRQIGVDVVLFGHSHIPEIFLHDSIVFMNPGSVGEPRGGENASCGIIEIRDGKIFPYIIRLNDKKG